MRFGGFFEFLIAVAPHIVACCIFRCFLNPSRRLQKKPGDGCLGIIGNRRLETISESFAEPVGKSKISAYLAYSVPTGYRYFLS